MPSATKPEALKNLETPKVPGERKLSKELEYFIRADGSTGMSLPEGRLGATEINVDLLTAKDMPKIDELFREILHGKGSGSVGESSEWAAKIAAAGGEAEDHDLFIKMHEMSEEYSRQFAGYKGYRELRLFLLELMSGNRVLGDSQSPRIARVAGKDKDLILSQFPVTFHSNEGNEIGQNAPAAELSEVFVISPADGERLKQIIIDCGKADETVGDLSLAKPSDTEGHRSENKLMIKMKEIRLAFIIQDSPALAAVTNLEDYKKGQADKEDAGEVNKTEEEQLKKVS